MTDNNRERSMRLKRLIEAIFNDTDMSGEEWDDYDKNGVAYWEKWKWDFEDKETGDAFRIIKE